MCGHGLSVIHALSDHQIPVIGLETNLDLPGVRTRFASLEQVDDINGFGLINALLDLRSRIHCPEQPVLFMTNDNMTRTLTMNWHLLCHCYFLSWGHCRHAIASFLEKSNLEAHCRHKKLLYPSSYLLRSNADIDEAIATTGKSAIIKPSRPLAKFKTAIPQKRADFEEMVTEYESDLPFLVQTFIQGDDSTIFFCALYLHYGEVLARFDGRKLRSRPMGHTTVAEPCRQDEIFRETLRFFSGFELSGPVSVEFKRDENGQLWVIEPTVGRTDFWVGLCTANGVNLPLTEYLSQLAIRPEFAPQRDIAVWFNEERDPFGRLWLAFHPIERMRKRQAEYLFLHKKDLKPGIKSVLRTIGRLCSSLINRLLNIIALKK